jgi:hypothetical protein
MKYFNHNKRSKAVELNYDDHNPCVCSNGMADAFSKKSSTKCEDDVCHTSICINNNCHTLVSNLTQQLNSMVQTKMHGLLSFQFNSRITEFD